MAVLAVTEDSVVKAAGTREPLLFPVESEGQPEAGPSPRSARPLPTGSRKVLGATQYKEKRKAHYGNDAKAFVKWFYILFAKEFEGERKLEHNWHRDCGLVQSWLTENADLSALKVIANELFNLPEDDYNTFTLGHMNQAFNKLARRALMERTLTHRNGRYFATEAAHARAN